MRNWSDPLHIVVNLTSLLVWVAALVDLVRTPRSPDGGDGRGMSGAALGHA